MEERARFLAGGVLEVRIHRGLHPLYYKDGALHVGDTILESDAQRSTMMETAAGLLLPPIEEPRGDVGWLEGLARTYRSRVIIDEYTEAEARLGGLARLLRARPSYPAVSRMSLLRRLYPCIYNKALEDLGALDEAYTVEHRRLGIDPQAPLQGLQGAKRSLAVARVAVAGYSALHPAVALLARLPHHATGCTPHRLLVEPWRLLSLPEGTVSLDCGAVDRVVEDLAGPGYKCRSPNPISSSLDCQGPRGRVIVKSYMRMSPKWIPAALAASPVYSYRLGPRERMEADYKYLRALRGTVETPIVHHVCGDLYNTKMVRSYLEGRVILHSRSPEDWSQAGKGLASIHKAGYTLGDTNPGNILATPTGKTGVIDAEQAREATPRGMAWDLIVLTVTSIFYGAPEDLITTLLASYKDTIGKGPLEEALRERNWIGLLSIPIIVQKSRNIIKKTIN
ncbi:MAG: hypothetical protein GSR84_06940 [Desulfurococcales archaeon]|nr:hypothetical protein [Desulfurococcales archaeon]